MNRRVIVAILGTLALAACGEMPAAPGASSAAETVAAAKKKAAQCSDYRPAVAHLLSLVDRQTSGDVRAILLADLQGAYTALDPAACDARLAIDYLQRFIVDVELHAASMTEALAVTLVTVARSVIGYLAPFAV